jgi:hypothetical protein
MYPYEDTCRNSWEEALEQDLVFQESSPTSLDKRQGVISLRDVPKTTRDLRIRINKFLFIIVLLLYITLEHSFCTSF